MVHPVPTSVGAVPRAENVSSGFVIVDLNHTCTRFVYLKQIHKQQLQQNSDTTADLAKNNL